MYRILIAGHHCFQRVTQYFIRKLNTISDILDDDDYADVEFVSPNQIPIVTMIRNDIVETKTTPISLTTCPICNGKGRITWLSDTCRPCKGSGYVEPHQVEKLIQYFHKTSL